MAKKKTGKSRGQPAPEPEITPTGPHQWVDVDVNWDLVSKPERKALVTAALRNQDVDLLWSVTEYNLRLYGRGGAHTSEHTLRAYRTGVWRFLQFAFPLGWRRMTEHDTDLTIGYLRALERTGLTPGTINSRRSAARALYRALRWAGVLHADPFADTPRAQDHEEKWMKREAYTREEVAALMAVADPDEQRMLLLGAHGALRISEMISLTWDRVDLERRTMTITGKGRKTARVNLSGPLHAALSAVPEPDRTDYVLPWRNPKTMRMLLRALCNLSGATYQKRQVHGLRHASATMLLEQTGDLYVVSRHLRHSSISTTEVYAKANPLKLVDAVSNWPEN